MTPGGFGWLLRHELRLALRGTGARVAWRRRAGPLLLLAAVPSAIGVALAIGLAWAAHGGRAPPPSTAVVGVAGAAVAGLLVLMVSTAALAVLRTFHDRGDLDLLLSAPVPPARVLAAKAVGVAVTVATPFTVLFAPFALTSAVLGFPRWLGGLVMVGVDATLATALAIGFVGRLFGALGARRARVAVQLGAAAIGGTVFLLSQSQSLAPGLAGRLFAAVARPWPTPFDWPGRAALGAPLPLAAMVGLGAAALGLAARRGGRDLVAAGDPGGGAAAARTTVVRFHPGLTRAIVVKELRLIARDPELISQIALRLVYLIPLAALVVRGSHGVDPGPALAAGATASAGLLASSLAWLVVAAEDAPDLLAAAPRAVATIARAKLIAATLVPAAVAGAAALAAAATASAAAGAVTLGMGLVAAASAAQIQAWFGRPAPRSAFRRRQSGSFVVGVGEIVLAGAWSATATLLVRGSPWALAPALLAAMIVAGAIEARNARA